FQVEAKASSKLKVTFAVASESKICEVGPTTVKGEISEATVQLNEAGECKIEAEQAGEPEKWLPETQPGQPFSVLRKLQKVEFTSTPPASATAGGSSVVTASATSNLAPALASATPGVCTLSGASSGSTVTFVG